MLQHARVVATADLSDVRFIALPVVVREDGAAIAASVPTASGALHVPHELSAEWCAAHSLSAPGTSAVVGGVDGQSFLLISIGDSYTNVDAFRRYGAAGARLAGNSSVAFFVPTEAVDDLGTAAHAIVEGALLASYDYKATGAAGEVLVVATGLPLPTITAHEAVVAGVHRGVVIANATNWAKRLVDAPPNVMTPKDLAKAISAEIEGLPHVSVDVWTESRIKEENLGAVIAVGSGSGEPSRVVIANYEPPNATAHIALVGKGITFDSGGLNIKPLASMVEMKCDMTGAAVVAGVLSVVAQLGLPVRVTVVAPLVENLLGDKAIKPGSVVTARSGTTIEIANPDAEGRLILADGIQLALEREPDVIIDIATLTGAMSTALGDQCAGFFASNTELRDRVLAASETSGEAFWPMPLFQPYLKNIASDVADINMGKFGGGGGGAIAAALFLEHFVQGAPWVHLDIAGPAMQGSASGYLTKGASAWGLRTLVAMLSAVATETKG